MFKPCNVMECLRHYNGIIPSLKFILKKKQGVRSGKYLLNTPENAISETLNFKMSLDASALKNLCLWCEFQSCLLFITSLLLKNFLTALYDLGTTVVLQYGSTTHTLYDKGTSFSYCETSRLLRQLRGLHRMRKWNWVSPIHPVTTKNNN